MPFLVDDKTVFPEEAYFFNQKNKNLSSISIIDEIYVLCRFENLPAYLLILQKLKKKKISFHQSTREKVQNVWCLVQVLGAGLAAFTLLKFLIAGCGPWANVEFSPQNKGNLFPIVLFNCFHFLGQIFGLYKGKTQLFLD